LAKTSKTVKPVIEHKDKLGKIIKVGDFVAAPYGTRDLRICSVESINPKMISVKPASTEYQSWRSISMKYPKDLIVIKDIEITKYFMTTPSNS